MRQGEKKNEGKVGKKEGRRNEGVGEGMGNRGREETKEADHNWTGGTERKEK